MVSRFRLLPLLPALLLVATCAPAPEPALTDRQTLDEAGGAQLPLPAITYVSRDDMDRRYGVLIPGVQSFYIRNTRTIVVSDGCRDTADCDIWIAHELNNYAHNGADDCGAYLFAAAIANREGKVNSARQQLRGAKLSLCPEPSDGWGLGAGWPW